MRITPLDVRKQEFRKAVRGLDTDEVQAFLATVADEYEFVLTDNKKLRERVIELDEKVGEYRNMEKTLRDTLLTAERVMTEARQNARKEADLILRDAQLKASQEVAGISGRVEALHQQIRELRGHRDSYLARLHSLSEAQLGLIDSYKKDFASSDARIDRAAEPVREAKPAEAPRPPVAEKPARDSSRSTIPAWDPPAIPSDLDDQWRSYDLNASRSRRQQAPEPVEFNAPDIDAPPHLHTPDPEPWQEAIRNSGSVRPVSGRVEPLSVEDYDDRAGSVAGARSGSVPRVESPEVPDEEAAAIDEVSAALGMFNERSDHADESYRGAGQSAGARPLGAAPSSPWPANELASGGVPTEPVDRAGGPEGSADEWIDASTDSDEQSGESRWSLSRIARGITGN